MMDDGGIFVQPPIYASKQPPNLRQLLVKNTITDDEPGCNKSCGKHRCNVCKHINTATTFQHTHTNTSTNTSTVILLT